MIHIKVNYNNEITIPLCLNSGNLCDDDVAAMEINETGDLVVTLKDGNTYNLGHLIGESEIIYKPRIERDKFNVFTFTLENNVDV